jgi:hypothetical protein
MKGFRQFLPWVLMGLILVVLLIAFSPSLARRNVSPSTVLAAVLVVVTAWYGYATHKISSANAELVAQTKAAAEQTRRLSDTARHAYLIQAIPVVALSTFEPREGGVRGVDPRGVQVAIKNVGGAPAILTSVVLHVRGIGGGGHTLGTAPAHHTPSLPAPPYSLGPGDDWTFFMATNPDTLRLDPTRSSCEITYTDAFGNQFLTQHSPARPPDIWFQGAPGERLPRSSLGVPLAQVRFDTTTGRLSAGTINGL